MWKFLKKLYFGNKPKDAKLIVMRLDDMFMQHPDQDNSRRCDLCGEPVGIYPNGQDFIAKHGMANVKLHCQRCVHWSW